MIRDATEVVLAIGAHPDDVVLGIGGTIAALADHGYRVIVLTLSSGELGGEPDVREREDLDACAELGATVEFGHLPDGAITQREAMSSIERAVRAYEPTYIFTHDPSDTHQDHVAVARAAIAVGKRAPNVFLYEGPSTNGFMPQCVTDVSATWHRKLAAVASHESQSSSVLLEWVHATARHRAWPTHRGVPCEALRVEHARFAAFAPVRSAVL